MHEHGVRYCLHARAWHALHILQKSAYLHARAWHALHILKNQLTCMHEHGVRYCLHARAWCALHILQNQLTCMHEHGVRYCLHARAWSASQILKKISLLACTSMALVAYFETFYFTNPYLAFFFESHVRHDTCMIHVRHDTCMIHVRHDTCMIHARLTAKAPIGALIYTAINSVPQICYVLSVLTRYMTAWMASPAGPAQRQHGA
jgi:hypothetical protein